MRATSDLVCLIQVKVPFQDCETGRLVQTESYEVLAKDWPSLRELIREAWLEANLSEIPF